MRVKSNLLLTYKQIFENQLPMVRANKIMKSSIKTTLMIYDSLMYEDV